MNIRIIALSSDNNHLIQQVAQLLVDAFQEHWPDAWPTLEEGHKEVQEMLETGRICRAAVDEKGSLLGIIGGIPGYDGHVWKLHPLAEQPNLQGQGIGRALLRACEERLKYPTIKQTVRISNQRAIALYEKEGYRTVDIWTKYYSDGEDGLVMEKDLRS